VIKTKTDRPTAEKQEKTEKQTRAKGPDISGGTDDARKTAAVVLEVLGGALTPTMAAEVLGVSSTRYYQLELRALKGLLRGCEPAHKGPSASPEKQVRRLERRMDRLQNECSRYRALARAAQAAVGLSLSDAEKPSGNGKRKRRPKARALRAASVLRSELPKAVGAADGS